MIRILADVISANCSSYRRDEAAMKVREPRQHRVPPTAYPSSSRATPEPTMFTNGNGSPEAADIADSDNAWGGPPAVTASMTIGLPFYNYLVSFSLPI